MQETLVYINGEYVPQSKATLSIFDAAVTLGFTLTESTRTFKHEPFRLRDHVDRLFKSAKAARLDIGMTPDEMEELTLEVWAKNEPLYAPGDDAWINHGVTPGCWIPSSGQQPADMKPTIIIFTLFLDLTYWARLYTEGAHAVTPWTRIQPEQSLDPRIKNRSRITYTLAEKEVKLVDPMAQSVLLDVHGFLTENKGGNFFIVSDGVLKTARGGALEGISRRTALELAEKLGIPNEACDLLPYDVVNADEAFFTSTPYCIFPAVKFNGIPIGDGKVGPIVKQLLAAWSDRVGLDIVKQAQDQLKR